MNKNTRKVPFGMYKGLSFDFVRKNYKPYYVWALKNKIKSFEDDNNTREEKLVGRK